MTTLPALEYPRGMKPSFIKIICFGDGYLRMTFPQPWFDTYGADLTTTCKLKMSSGVTTTVGITKTSGKTYIEQNWRDFVYTHTIEIGDTLVFTYDEGRDFKVIRFKANGCMPDIDITGPEEPWLGGRRYYPDGTESEDSDVEPPEM
ncbi:putative B3 domain-containing protein isoform X3 [Salvia divinorum]|uniref:B3 domain-containing protein isoform X3 n=1 Tax=Salvia divinorum TaxID=28513 RepID=A0ABD1FKB3_SALDI